MTTNVIINYVIYKTGDDWNKLLHKIFVEDAKLLKEFIFIRLYMLIKLVIENLDEYGRLADRYDYVRIANMINWNNDTCVGKYLKTMYENRLLSVEKQFGMYSKFKGNHSATQTYGGQFHFDPIGLEDRPILMMIW